MAYLSKLNIVRTERYTRTVEAGTYVPRLVAVIITKWGTMYRSRTGLSIYRKHLARDVRHVGEYVIVQFGRIIYYFPGKPADVEPDEDDNRFITDAMMETVVTNTLKDGDHEITNADMEAAVAHIFSE